jgi:hypothetical protein
MRKKQNHVAIGVAFVVACIVIAVLLYVGPTRFNNAPDDTHQQAIANEIASTGVNFTDPDNVHRAATALADTEATSEENDGNNTEVAATDGDVDNLYASSCTGYWQGKNFGVAILQRGNSKDFTIGYYPEGDELATEEAQFYNRDGVSGEIKEDEASISYSNLGSVSMKCSGDIARDEEGGPMRKVTEEEFRKVNRPIR